MRFQCTYRQVEIQFTCSFQISQHFLGTCQICKCWWRKFVWQAFCRKHQIWSHSSNVLQFSDNCSDQWVLNLIARCGFIVQIQTLLFRQMCHHCLCVLQLNNVQTFVNVLGSRFHCESSAVTIVYTSVLESQVNYGYSWIEFFSSLDHDQFRDLRPEFSKRGWLGTNERVVCMGYHTCFVRLMHKQTSIQFAAFETHVLWVFQPGILWNLGSLFARHSSPHVVSKSIHRVLVPSEVERTFHRMSLHAWKHTPGLQFPLEDRTMLHTAIVHALTMEMGFARIRHLSLSSRNPSAHISTSLPSPSIVEPNLWAEPICWEVCQSPLTQEYSCRSFICWISRSSPALTLSAGSPSIKAPSYVARIARSAFGQASSLTSNFTPSSPRRMWRTFLATRAFFDTFSSSTFSSWWDVRWSSLEVILIHWVRRGCFWSLRVGICWTRTRVHWSCVRISNNSAFRLLRWCYSAAIFPGI